MCKRIVCFLIITLFLALSSMPVLASHVETSGDHYYTLVDEANHIVHKTGLTAQVGDIYIAADNSRYKVIEVTGSIAKCKYQGKEIMPEIQYNAQKQAYIFFDDSFPAAADKKPTIAIYHTHSDESYVPTDGKESILGNGGIYDVGKTL